MSMSVSSLPIRSYDPDETPATAASLSAAAQKRQEYLARLLDLAQSSQPVTRWVQELRDRAVPLVQAQAFPTTRDEEWRFTDLSALLDVPLEVFRPNRVSTAAIAPFVLPEASRSRLVFVNGVYAPELSAIANLPDGLLLGDLSDLEGDARLPHYLGKQPGSEELFTALNTVGLRDAAVLLIPRNLVVETPIHLLFVSTTGETPIFTQPRCLVVAEPSSAVTLIEDFVTIGAGTYFTNPVSEIWLEENAQVNHTRLQRDSQNAYHIGKTAVSQARDSRYTCNAVSVGAGFFRHHLTVYPNGEQTETHLNGLTMIAGEQVSDTHSAIALSRPHCTARQLHKCIIDDRAHAIFNGKVFVPKTAQLTDAGQLNRNLLLSPKARIDTKPQLEIVADNVKCTHGAAVSQLDANEVFYLQSRGIDAASAQKLLVYAFAYEILNKIPLASLRQTLSEFVTAQTH
ncbi:MAG TPA: Fe-S cluster assembly protein SufD [Synechococcales cyanobacterium M55_K2018_004]|nr:Fe-S cluster assembly protein SufD [Synechococcales cyanobacterium M55_K2018_004]